MPSKIFGLDLRRASQQYSSKKPSSAHTSPLSTPTAESPRPSMDNLMRPFMKKQGSHDKKDNDRSLSKDKNAKDSKPAVSQPKAVKLGMEMESPPAIFHGPISSSSGALISGRLQVTPTSSDVTLNTIAMYLEATSTTKKPVLERCRECMAKVSDMFEWNFLTKPKVFELAEGMQELPFSHLIPGHLPATTHGQIGTLDYSLHVRAKTDQGQEIEFRRELIIQRALPPGSDKTSIRVFPPTDLRLNVTVPNIIYPIGDFPVVCSMTGVTTKRDDAQLRWKLRKVTWKIQEHETLISPACEKHANRVGGTGKGIYHENTRDLASGELKEGWKTDYNEGRHDGEFTASMDSARKPQCDVEAEYGFKITHSLAIELVMGEEWSPYKKPQQVIPTGAARVLRTQFALHVTERAGMGISWDEEQPPQYSEVPPSPPHYQSQHTTIEEYHGDDLHEDIEQLNLGE